MKKYLCLLVFAISLQLLVTGCKRKSYGVDPKFPTPSVFDDRAACTKILKLLDGESRGVREERFLAQLDNCVKIITDSRAQATPEQLNEIDRQRTCIWQYQTLDAIQKCFESRK